MSCYICTSKGFLKPIIPTNEMSKPTLEFTDKVRFAQLFKSKAAKKTIEKYNIDGFIWKPYEQEPIRDMYRVEKRRDSFDFIDNNAINEWVVNKAVMEHDSDVRFLNNKKPDKTLMSFDVASNKALHLNLKMLAELSDNIKNTITNINDLNKE